MNKKVEPSVQDPYVTSGRAEARLKRKLGLQVFSYGVTAGLATTALGAFAASAVSGPAKTFLWIFVTGVLAVGAVALADPAFVGLVRRYYSHRLRRTRGAR